MLNLGKYRKANASRHGSALYSVLSNFLRIFTGPVSIFFVVSKLTIVEQTIYYNFITISAIQWIFELGLTTSLIQMLCSEKKRSLKISKINFGVIFFSISSSLLFLSMVVYAKWLFSGIDKDIWFLPFLLYATGVFLNINCNILYIVEESTGSIHKTYRVKLISGVLYSLALLLSLYFDLNLFALGIAQLFMFLVSIYTLRSRVKMILIYIKLFNLSKVVDSARNIIKFQMKLSAVWLIGYLYWNFNAVFFLKFTTVNFSAQYNSTITVFNAIATSLAALIITKRAVFGRMISSRRFIELKRLAFESFILMSLLYLIISIIAFFVILLLPSNIATRFYPTEVLTSLVVLRFAMMIYDSILIFLRCYQDEPFFYQTIILYILMPITTVISYVYMGSNNTFLLPMLMHVIFDCILIYRCFCYVGQRMNHEKIVI